MNIRIEQMGDTKIIYSIERKTWNVFHNGEWYYESKDYDQANEVYGCLVCPLDMDEYYEDEEEYDYE